MLIDPQNRQRNRLKLNRTPVLRYNVSHVDYFGLCCQNCSIRLCAICICKHKYWQLKLSMQQMLHTIKCGAVFCAASRKSHRITQRWLGEKLQTAANWFCSIQNQTQHNVYCMFVVKFIIYLCIQFVYSFISALRFSWWKCNINSYAAHASFSSMTRFRTVCAR